MTCRLVGANPLSKSDGILLIGHLGTNFSEAFIEIDITLENAVCKMAVIFSRPQRVKTGLTNSNFNTCRAEIELEMYLHFYRSSPLK